MKKLLVLMLVLALGSLASAAFMLEKQAGDDTVGRIMGDGVMKGYYLTADKPVELTLHYQGSATTVTDVSDIQDYIDVFGPVNIFELIFADSTAPPDTKLPNGLVMTVKALETGDTLVNLCDFDDGSVLSSVILTPEPMSLMLLGLGGLFLRRRK